MIEWLENHPFPCFYKCLFGIECPTCGFQRALILLLKGELTESIVQYPPLIPTILLIFLSVVQLIFNRPGWLFIKRFALFDLALILVSYFFRIIF
ncbi:MAG: DUF2752 domain-containing protein [Bacteroidales bacterium]|jgi:hypothetical protein